MSNVRAEVLRVSRSRTGWKEADHAKNQRPCISSLKSTFETRGDNEATSPRSETPKGNGGSCGGNDMFKPARPAGTKVSSIANMFQSLSPHKEDNIQSRTVFAKPETTHVLKKSTESIDLVTTENWKNNSVREVSAPVSGVGGGGTGGGGVGQVTGNVHLARTESHLARFNNARAMFERLEEKNVTRVKSSCGYNLNLKKRSGSVSPSRSSPTRTNYSSNNSRSPSPGDIQSVGSSPKKDSQLSPREKSWSADNILGVRNRDNSAVISKFYESSHINGARANMELNLELRESGAGEAIVSPSPLSPGLVNYLIASPLDDDGPVTNGKNGTDSETRSASRANSYAKPLIPPHKPNVNAASLASKINSTKKEVPKRDESLSPSKRPDSSHMVHEPNDYDSGLRPRVISSTPSKGLGSKSSEEKTRSQIPQLMQKETTQKLTNKINHETDGNSGEQGGAALISASSNSLEIASRQFTSVPPPPPLPPSSPLVSVSEDLRQRGAVKNDESEKCDNSSNHQQLITSITNLSHIPATTTASSCESKQNGFLGGSDSHIPQVAQVTTVSKSTTISNTSKTATVISSDETYLNQLCEEESTNYHHHHAFTNGVASVSVTREQLLAAEEASYKEFLLEGLQETVVDPENGSDIIASTTADGMSFETDNWTNSFPELPVESIHVKDEEVSSTGESSSPSHSQRWSTGTEELPTSVETSIRLEPTYLKNVSQGTSPLSPSNFLERVENEIVEEETNCVKRTPEPEIMTVLEAEQLLSRRLCPELLSDEEANEVKKLLKMESESSRSEADVVASTSDEDEVDDSEEDEDDEPQEGCYEIEEGVNYLKDGHFWVEVPGLPESDEDITDCYNAITMPKKRDRVRFSTQPMKVYSTHSVNDYDRRNDEVDPVSASAEYELEKRVEKMDVFPIELMKGSEGLGLSIIGMGVGADAGLEKLGIFVKTITDGGAAHKDGRINVNDQIIEVDGKSLVGVTQAYAASVLRNTAGLVRFLIGREKDGENSEVAQLISQSLMADRDRDERRRSMELELQRQREEEPREDGHPGLTLPIPSLTLQLPTTPQVIVQEDSTPEEGEDCPTCEVFDLEDDSSDSPSPDSDVTNLKIKLKEAQYKNAVAEAEAANTRVKLAMLESVHADQVGSEKRVQMLLDRLTDAEKIVESTKKDIMTYQDMLEESQGQYILLEKKYYKAKKIIKDFQLRQHDLVHREEFHLQQLQEKDQEYNALVKFLKDRVIQLEHDLTETQKLAGLPVRLPYDSNSIKQLQLPPQIKKPQSLEDQKGNGLVDMSDGECSEGDLTKYDISPISDDAENKTSTVERKPSTKEDVFEKAVPHTELLDNAPAKAKAELACKGSLANRQPPSLKKTGSTGSSSDGMSQDLRDSISSLNSSHEDLDECNEQNPGDKTSFSTSFSSDSSPAVTPLPSESLADDAAVLENKRAAHGILSHTSPLIGKDREGRGSPIRIDDRFAEEMRLILERKTVEVKSKIPDIDSDQLKTDHQLGVDGQRILTPSPGSASTHSSDSNAPSTLDLSHSPSHNQKPRSYIKIQDSSILEKSHDFESRHYFEGKNIVSHGEHPSSLSEKRSYQWHSCSVIEWSTAQVGQWLLALSMEQYISNFMDGNVGGKDLLQVDGAKLKILGVNSGTDRSTLKKKIKELRIQAEKERKAVEKELKTREKMQRKADKAAEKASVKRK